MKYVFLVVVVSSLCTGCNRAWEVEPRVDFVDGNVLLPRVSFTTSENVDAYIAYWPAGDQSKIQKSSVSKGTQHAVVLVNLKPSGKYKYMICNHASGGKSDTFSFETQALPDVITQTKKHTIDTARFSGFVLVRGLSPKGSDVIIDNEGDVVWYHLYDTAVRRPFNWTQRSTILSHYDTAQIVEHDLYGAKKLDIKIGDNGFLNLLHHDVVYDAVGDIVSLTHDSAKVDLRKFNGKKDQYVRADGIIVLDTLGNRKWLWNLLDVFKLTDFPLTEVNLTHSLGHANSVAVDEDGNLIVSFRDFSQLWKINRTDGKVMWKLGKHGNIKLDEEGYFIRQHSIHRTSDGHWMIFDNGDRSSRPYSRVLAFDVNEEKMEATLVVNIKLPLELSADKMCSAEEIKKGEYLVCTSKKKGIISVVNESGEVLWRVDLTSPSYRAYYLKNPFSVYQF